MAALHAAAEVEPALDLARVGIRGWSFGGYLAALAVLRAPDVFHAAVAGAPVTDWRLYDTHYTERYLGTDPDGDPDAYGVRRHVAAGRRPAADPAADARSTGSRTTTWSSRTPCGCRSGSTREPAARTRCCRSSGVTHMTPQEAVAENLLLLQVEFLDRALGPR